MLQVWLEKDIVRYVETLFTRELKEQFYDPSNIGHFMPTSSESNKLNVFLYFRNQ